MRKKSIEHILVLFQRTKIHLLCGIIMQHQVLHSPRRCVKPPFLGVSECKYGVRTPERALTITVFTDIGAVGTVIFLYIRKVLS